jgi:hypothetical protein
MQSTVKRVLSSRNSTKLPPLTATKPKPFDLSDEVVRQFLEAQLDKFDCRMDFETMFVNRRCGVRAPTLPDIVDFCLYVVLACKMEHEMPVICLVYL